MVAVTSLPLVHHSYRRHSNSAFRFNHRHLHQVHTTINISHINHGRENARLHPLTLRSHKTETRGWKAAIKMALWPNKTIEISYNCFNFIKKFNTYSFTVVELTTSPSRFIELNKNATNKIVIPKTRQDVTNMHISIKQTANIYEISSRPFRAVPIIRKTLMDYWTLMDVSFSAVFSFSLLFFSVSFSVVDEAG